jgi:dihydropteroate synthase
MSEHDSPVPGVPLDRPGVMGILNVTPDSFSDGGRHTDVETAVASAEAMLEAGATIIDVGGESTRPGAQPVAEAEEIERVAPVVEALVGRLGCPVSVDTSKPAVMREAVRAGAVLINDVRSLRQDDALATAAELEVAVCVMHMQGEPTNMQDEPFYQDVVTDVMEFLEERVYACERAGIPRERILIDPGFGFAKDLGHNLTLLKHLDRFQSLGLPMLVGVSRKSMIGQVLGRSVEERLPGSLALAALAVWQNATLIRAHDVAATVDAVRMIEAVRNA